MPTVLITGAGRGLGLEFARQYADDGWTVHAACREPEAAAGLRGLGDGVRLARLDVTSAEQVAELADEVARRGYRPVAQQRRDLWPARVPPGADRLRGLGRGVAGQHPGAAARGRGLRRACGDEQNGNAWPSFPRAWARSSRTVAAATSTGPRRRRRTRR